MQHLEPLGVHQASLQDGLDRRGLRGLEQAKVEPAVMLQQPVFVPLKGRKAHALKQIRQVIDERWGGFDARGCPALDPMPDAQEFFGIFHLREHDMGITTGTARDQPLFRQSHQGFTDCPLGTAKLMRQIQLAQGISGRNFPKYDRATDRMLDRLAAALVFDPSYLCHDRLPRP